MPKQTLKQRRQIIELNVKRHVLSRYQAYAAAAKQDGKEPEPFEQYVQSHQQELAADLPPSIQQEDSAIQAEYAASQVPRTEAYATKLSQYTGTNFHP